MSGSGLTYSGAWPADDDIIPAGFVASRGRVFFVRMSVQSRNPANHSDDDMMIRRIVKLLSIPAADPTIGRDFITDRIHQIGVMSSAAVIAETILQFTCCALVMLKNPANEGRLVLPMEVLISCTAKAEGGSMQGEASGWPEVVEFMCPLSSTLKN